MSFSKVSVSFDGPSKPSSSGSSFFSRWIWKNEEMYSVKVLNRSAAWLLQILHAMRFLTARNARGGSKGKMSCFACVVIANINYYCTSEKGPREKPRRSTS